MPASDLPPIVVAAKGRASAAGFALSCEDDVGRLLAVLAAGVAPGGRILELGTGAGVGIAWLAHGIGSRDDVELTTVELDHDLAAAAAEAAWPPSVRLTEGDAVDHLVGPVDLIFADAPAGKWWALDRTIAALAPGGLLVVDDMAPPSFADDEHERKTAEVRATLLDHPELCSVELGWSSGIIVSARRP